MLSNKALLVVFLALSGVLTPDGRGTRFATAKPTLGFIGEFIFGPAPTQPPRQPISVNVAPVNNARFYDYSHAQPTGQQFPTMPQPPTPPPPPNQQQQGMAYQPPANQYQQGMAYQPPPNQQQQGMAYQPPPNQEQQRMAYQPPPNQQQQGMAYQPPPNQQQQGMANQKSK